MALHSPPPLRRWISSLESDQEQPEKALDGVPPRVVRLLAEGKNKVHPGGSARGGGSAQRPPRHGLGHVMPLRGGVSFRNRSKSIQPMACGHSRALKAPCPTLDRHSSLPLPPGARTVGSESLHTLEERP